MEAIRDSLPYRPGAKLPAGGGYKVRVREFLIGVGHSVGVRELTWGLWMMVLEAMNGYVQAYPKYDFEFEIRKYRDEEDIEGYMIGAGFAMVNYEGGDEQRGISIENVGSS